MSKVRLYGDTSGFVDLKAPDVANDVTITLPNTTGPFATETYVDAAVAAIPGIGSNVVGVTKTDTFSASIASNTETDVTGFSVTITPTNASSKILVIYNAAHAVDTHYARLITVLYRDATAIAIGDAGALHKRATTYAGAIGNENNDMGLGSATFLDSPATTSAVTYKVRLYNSQSFTSTVYLNRSSADSNSGNVGRPISTITAIEVAA